MKTEICAPNYINIKNEPLIWKNNLEQFIEKAEQDEVELLNYGNNTFSLRTVIYEDLRNNDIYSHLFMDNPRTYPSGNLNYGVNKNLLGSELRNIKLNESAFKKYTTMNGVSSSNNVFEYAINDSNVMIQTSSNNNNKSIHKNKPLNKKAVRIMEKWYINHIDYPYPKVKQKEKLAMKGSISIAQVNSWFANRRNRSDNTKPKKNRKCLETQLMLYAKELESQSYGSLKGSSISNKLSKILNQYQN